MEIPGKCTGQTRPLASPRPDGGGSCVRDVWQVQAAAAHCVDPTLAHGIKGGFPGNTKAKRRPSWPTCPILPRHHNSRPSNRVSMRFAINLNSVLLPQPDGRSRSTRRQRGSDRSPPGARAIAKTFSAERSPPPAAALLARCVRPSLSTSRRQQGFIRSYGSDFGP